MIEFITNPDEKERIATHILNRLPEWFGIPESTQEYIRESCDKPFWSHSENGVPTGFIVLNATSPYTAEIFVMGVLKEHQRKGVGRMLWEAFREYAKANDFEYAQVKTVRMGKYTSYDATNAFYQKLGFRELECFPTLWDEHNPCQIYVQCLL